MILRKSSTIIRFILDDLPGEDLNLTINQPGKYHIVTRYLVTPKHPLTLSDYITINVPNAIVNYDCFGVVTENSEKILKFTLDFQNKSDSSVGQEKVEVLLLGPPKLNSSSPIILCSNPTISGSHGVTLGKTPETELNYLRARGLSKREAEKLLIRCRFDEAFKLAKTLLLADNNLEAKFDQILKEILP